MIHRRQVPAPTVVPSAARSRTRRPRRLHRAFPHLIVVLLAVGAASAPAYGTAYGAVVPTPGYPTFDPNASIEHITSYDVTLKIRRDGGMHVTEMIRYTFAGEPHAIVRTIPNLRHVDAGHDQVLGVHDVRVRGADDLKVRTAHDATVLTFGGHDAATSGGGTYVIDYDVAHALTPGNGTDDLDWAATGAPWKVPISAASVTISAPVSVAGGAFPNVVVYTTTAMDRRCDHGFQGDIYVCPMRFTDDHRTLRFGTSGLAPGENMDLSLELPKNGMDVPAPPLRPRVNPFAASTTADGLTLVAVGLLLAAAWLLLPRPTWRREVSRTSVDVPPSGVGPALAGVLRSGGTASDHHLDALLIDLAVRGYLRFEEYRIRENKVGHRLVRGDRPAGDLELYEAAMIEGTLGTAESVELSALRRRGGPDAVRGLLEEEVRRRRWIRRRPATQRAFAVSHEALLALTGAGLLVASFTKGSVWGIPTMGLVRPGVVFLVVALVAGRFGRRTPRTVAGSRALARVNTYANTLETWAELSPRDPRVDAGLVSSAFPYAMGLGQVAAWVDGRWGTVFDELDEDLSWYRAADGPGTRPLRRVDRLVDFLFPRRPGSPFRSRPS